MTSLIRACGFTLVAIYLATPAFSQHEPHDMSGGGISDPKMHLFADPSRGRDGYSLANEPVNEFRLYDFYQRQADHYMKQKPTKFLPAYPGLDAGMHGHWGKFSQNQHNDDRWNHQRDNTMQGGRLIVGKIKVEKAINLSLGDDGELGACFDPWTFTYRYVWSGGGVKYDGYRWGTSRGVKFEGPILLSHDGSWRDQNSPKERMKDSAFHGVYRHGKRVAFSYRIGNLELLDSPWVASASDIGVFTRHIQLRSKSGGQHQIQLCKAAAGFSMLANAEGEATAILHQYDSGARIQGIYKDDDCWLFRVPQGMTLEVSSNGHASVSFDGPIERSIALAAWQGKLEQKEAAITALKSVSGVLPSLGEFRRGGPAQWSKTVTTTGEISRDTDPYVVDEIPLPFENPYGSVMMLSGIDFLPNGDAFVCTLPGDVWKVTGLDDGLERVTWKRFAAGLTQPFGIKIQGDNIFVLCKDRMQILRDLNGDDEADFYENYDNSWVEDHGHTHVFGADRDRYGNFYFPAYDKFYKLPPDGSGVKLIANGFRNCMGVAVNEDGLVLAAPQEGTWTPASMIIEVHEGEHYGFRRTNEEISPPMCFIPRGVDNSTGGMIFVDSDRWGPLGKSLIGLSYGSGLHYLILRDESGPRAQGATVPLKGEFPSGVVRGRINPKDGQLYVVGTDGWGNYAIQDGCLNRIRYTGEPVHKPIGFQVHSNGIRIDFSTPLDSETASKVTNYFAQQWNYEHSKSYGSVEYSVFRPHMIGHDRVEIRSVQILNKGKSVFLEVPRIVPCYQMHIRMHLASKDGTPFETEIFPTVLSLGQRYEFRGAVPHVPGRATTLKLRVREYGDVALRGHDPKLKTDRTITLNAITGVQYDRKTLVAHAGEAIELKLKNGDGMPHNLVLVQPGAYEKVGKLSFKMLNDPDAFAKSYVPDVPEVITHTAVVFPQESSSTKFEVPEKPGAYPFLCTFPGHWQSMRGQLVVVPKDKPLPDPNAISEVTLASQLSKEDPKALIAAARERGNPEVGASLFYNKQVSCATCHDPPQGTALGPKLTQRHDKTSDAYLLESILKPSQHIRKGYEPVIVMTFDGKMRSGVRVSEDDTSITLRDLAAGGELLKYRKEDLDDVMHSKVSAMPAGLANNLQSRQQFLDLLSFVYAISDGGEKRLTELK